MTAKFKVGDVCEVFYTDGKGSEPRTDFKIKECVLFTTEEGYIYFPDDGKQGAYESQLRLQCVKNWRKRIQK